ncbi:hypothetical protein [Streptomyces paludis]|uniref:Uncharacterized protein n=1 Tax=Streptomyces paludis TaxID=2282738 RepID=A0A345HZW1_9ACTN|nr:hypothetical protein [Streptomyces paludis]AXG82235.1 hypothetical protein DVK44_36185 [Streptomyces paludis]
MTMSAHQLTRNTTMRRTGAGVLGTSAVAAVTGVLKMVDAPWPAVVTTLLLALVVVLVLGLAHIVMPDQSEHKRDLLHLWLRQRGHRARARARAEARALGPAGATVVPHRHALPGPLPEATAGARPPVRRGRRRGGWRGGRSPCPPG